MPLRVVAGPGAQGKPFKLVKSTQTGKIAAETASNTVSVTIENNPPYSPAKTKKLKHARVPMGTYVYTRLAGRIDKSLLA